MTDGRPREFPSQPLPGALAAVVRDGRLLLVQRAKDPDKGLWGLPGGMVEGGEASEQAAVRELAEETGIIADGGTVIDRFDVRTGGGRFHYTLAVVRLNWRSGDGTAASDAAALGWFTPGEIDRLPCTKSLAGVVRLLF